MQMVQESAVHFVCTLCQQDDDGVAQCTFAILLAAAPNTACSANGQRFSHVGCTVGTCSSSGLPFARETAVEYVDPWPLACVLPTL